MTLAQAGKIAPAGLAAIAKSPWPPLPALAPHCPRDELRLVKTFAGMGDSCHFSWAGIGGVNQLAKPRRLGGSPTGMPGFNKQKFMESTLAKPDATAICRTPAALPYDRNMNWLGPLNKMN